MTNKMKWYETWDYQTRRLFWWTQRDSNGVCFEIRKADNNTFNLYKCDDFFGNYKDLQKAMNAAIA